MERLSGFAWDDVAGMKAAGRNTDISTSVMPMIGPNSSAIAFTAALLVHLLFLVSLGGDIATSGGAPEGGWRIRVTDDHRSHHSAPGQTIAIHSGGLATSSTAVRRWSHAGHTMHHIIDPRTGAPVKDTWRTVSVAAATCADANIAATAALVRGARAAGWLAGLGLPARLLDWQGNVTAVGDWPVEAATRELAA